MALAAGIVGARVSRSALTQVARGSRAASDSAINSAINSATRVWRRFRPRRIEPRRALVPVEPPTTVAVVPPPKRDLVRALTARIPAKAVFATGIAAGALGPIVVARVARAALTSLSNGHASKSTIETATVEFIRVTTSSPVRGTAVDAARRIVESLQR